MISAIHLSFADQQKGILEKILKRNPWSGGNIANGGPGGWGGNGGNAMGNGNGGNGGDGGPGGNGGNVWIGYPNGVFPSSTTVAVGNVIRTTKGTKRPKPKPWMEVQPSTDDDEDIAPTTEFDCESDTMTTIKITKKPSRPSKKPGSTKKPFSKKTTTRATTTTENDETDPFDDYDFSEDRIAKSSTERPTSGPIVPILRPWLKPVNKPLSPLPQLNTLSTPK